MMNAVTDSVKSLGEKTASLFESKPKDAGTIGAEAARDTKDLIEDKATKVTDGDAGSGFLDSTTEQFEKAKKATSEAIK